ncbi:MAG: hypothetical protein RML72_12630 [Bacteroidia bacterium]|nr:hypothetical protein [Bacteroidia bacterium]MDW8159705.1 hypothetical protein [Bacteroidia bacterium]
MKTQYSKGWGLFLLFCLFVVSRASGQLENLDLTKVHANRDTKEFSDGKNNVTSYINAVLKAKTKCCGSDNLYVEVKVDEFGNVTNARALMGKNECIKKSVADIIKYIRWSTNPETDTKPIFYMPIKVDAGECKGNPDDNAYAAVPPPPGWQKSTQPIISSSTPSKPTPAPAEKPVTSSEPTPAPSATPSPTSTPPSQGNTTNVKPSPTPLPKVKTASTQEYTTCQELPKVLPLPKYKSQGELYPDASHRKSILNTQGPINEVVDYATSKSATALMIKTQLRKNGICGLAQVLAELTVQPDGSIGGYRIFKTNTDKVASAIASAMCSIKFKPLPRRTYYIYEFKSDIDCPGQPRIDLEQVGTYFVAPEKGIRTRKQEDVRRQIDN